LNLHKFPIQKSSGVHVAEFAKIRADLNSQIPEVWRLRLRISSPWGICIESQELSFVFLLDKFVDILYNEFCRLLRRMLKQPAAIEPGGNNESDFGFIHNLYVKHTVLGSSG